MGELRGGRWGDGATLAAENCCGPPCCMQITAMLSVLLRIAVLRFSHAMSAPALIQQIPEIC